MKKASLTVRFLAFLVDICFLACVYSLLSIIGAAGLFLGAGFSRPWRELFPAVRFLVPMFLLFKVFLFFFYFTYLTANGEKTIGKTLFRLKVVTKKDGASLGLPRACLRALGYCISAFPLFLGFWMAFLTGKRAGHDLIAGTIVIKED